MTQTKTEPIDERRLVDVKTWRKLHGQDAPASDEKVGMVKLVTVDIIKGAVDPATGMHDIASVISTDAPDRDRDVLDQSGWDLKAYKKNPVVLWAHDHRGPPIAKTIEIGLDDKGRLRAVDRFTPKDVNPFGFQIYNMVMTGFIRAKSVGFDTTEWSYDEERHGYNLVKNELWEHSWCPVGSNPEALIQASKSIDLAPLKDWAREYLKNNPDPNRVFLWLDRSVVKSMWKQINYADGLATVPTVAKGSFFTTDDTGSDADADATAPVPQDEIKVTADAIEKQPEDFIMDEKAFLESMASLTDAIKENTAQSKALVDSIAKEREEDTSVELDDLVVTVSEEFKSSKTGKLPDGKE